MASRSLTSDERSALLSKLEMFNLKAEVGKYKIDAAVPRLLAARGLDVDVVKARRLIWRAAYLAASAEFHDRVEHPKLLATAKAYDNLLRSIRLNVAAAVGHDQTELSRIYLHLPLDAEVALDHSTQAERLEVNIESFHYQLNQMSTAIDLFLQENIIPQYERNGSNRADRFMREYFALVASAVWPALFRRSFLQDDLQDFIRLVATALADFGYPLSEAEMRSDDWLRDRVRKQFFGK